MAASSSRLAARADVIRSAAARRGARPSARNAPCDAEARAGQHVEDGGQRWPLVRLQLHAEAPGEAPLHRALEHVGELAHALLVQHQLARPAQDGRGGRGHAAGARGGDSVGTDVCVGARTHLVGLTVCCKECVPVACTKRPAEFQPSKGAPGPHVKELAGLVALAVNGSVVHCRGGKVRGRQPVRREGAETDGLPAHPQLAALPQVRVPTHRHTACRPEYLRNHGHAAAASSNRRHAGVGVSWGHVSPCRPREGARTNAHRQCRRRACCGPCR